MLPRFVLLAVAVLAFASGTVAQNTCGPLQTECDDNAHCEYHYGSAYCSCNSGYEGTGRPGECTEIYDRPLYALCRSGAQCCGSPFTTAPASTLRDCEIRCDYDGRCSHLAFRAGTGDCFLYSACTGYKTGGSWQLSTRDADYCPSRSGCKIDLRIAVTHAPVRRGQHVVLRATVTRSDNGRAVKDVRINFTVLGRYGAGSSVTNHQGVATYRYKYPQNYPKGRQRYTASHPGSSGTNAVHADGTLNVS